MMDVFTRARRALAVAGVLAALTLVPTKASAAPLFFTWGGTQTSKIADFPDTPNYTDRNGKHVDPAVCYKQVAIFFLPVWNYDVEWCGVIRGDTENYWKYTRDELQPVALTAGITLPEEPKIPAWDAYGGKIVFALLVGGYLFFRMNQSKKKPEPAAATQPAAPTPPPGPTPPAA